MSERDLARHRSPQRPATFLSDAGEAVTGRLAVVSRSSAVLAVSTGMLATGGLPVQSLGADAASTLSSSPVSATTSNGGAANAIRHSPTATRVGAGALSSAGVLRSNGALTAPMAATVTFESSAFRADPAPARAAAARPSPYRNAAPVSASPTRTQSSSAKAAPASAPARATPAAAPARAVPARKGPLRHPVSAPPPPHRAVEAPPKPKRHVEAPAAPQRPAPATPKKPPAAKPSAPVRATPPSTVRGSDVLAVAARYVGTPYRYGGTTPRGFDCSGYVGYVYRQLGISLPRTANQLMGATRRISRSQARAGDLVFFVSAGRAYHVGIYAGHGQMYDAPHTGKTVQKRALWTSAVVYGRVTR